MDIVRIASRTGLTSFNISIEDNTHHNLTSSTAESVVVAMGLIKLLETGAE